MQELDFYSIAERYLELINPTSPEKVIEAGKYLGLAQNSRVIDFGCGYGEPLVLWARHFGIVGVGIDVREQAVARARRKMTDNGLDGRIEIVCARGAEYQFDKEAFDIAICMGASFIWDGFRPTLQALRTAIKPSGKILIGEPYWITDAVPPQYAFRVKIHTELELLDICHCEGFDIAYIIRSNDDDWAHYEAGNWQGLIAWLEENPSHAEKQEVIDWFRKVQDDYFRFGRQYLGFALYILNPIRYLLED